MPPAYKTVRRAKSDYTGGFRFVGIELDALHVDIARARLAHATGGDWEPMTEQATAEPPKQGSLF